MKKLLLFTFLICSTIIFGQTYQLLPDSCTFCLFKSSTGGNSWDDNLYSILPDQDTIFMGNSYMKISNTGIGQQPFAFRQSGNQLKGIVHDSITEFLIMDFNVAVGDTIYNLYSEGFFYHAKVVVKDSILINDGIYHKFINLEGTKIYQGGWWQDYTWPITWNERALCGWNMFEFDGEHLGGPLFNIPSNFYSISILYAFPSFCTTDTLYINQIGITCENCIPQTNSIYEMEQINFDLFPNPTNEKLKISFTNVEKREISILNSFGQIIIHTSTEFAEIELITKELSNGIYLINVKTKNSNSTKRFIKN